MHRLGCSVRKAYWQPASSDALRQFKVIDILTVSTGIADLPDSVHIALEGNDLTDAELMGDEDFIIALFQLLVEFHYGPEGHKFESLPRRSEAVVGIVLVVSMDNRIALEVRGIDFMLELASVRSIDNYGTYEPYRIGIVLVGKIVYERSAESYLDTVEIAHEQQTKVKIEIIEIDRILERSALDILVCPVAKFGI